MDLHEEEGSDLTAFKKGTASGSPFVFRGGGSKVKTTKQKIMFVVGVILILIGLGMGWVQKHEPAQSAAPAAVCVSAAVL